MGGDLEEPSPKVEYPFTNLFNELFPSYLAIGMTYELYWDESPSLAKSYKKAFMLKRDNENFKMWLQGGYIRSAILSTVGNMFSKNGDFNYPDEPYPLSKKEVENVREKEVFNKGLAYMQAQMMKRGG